MTATQDLLQREEFDRFYVELANGLHAMAQPLTILRSAMEIMTLPRTVGVDHGRYLEISARQVERTCGLFADLQDLVTARVTEAQRARLDLRELLDPMLESRRVALDTAGVGLAMVNRDAWEPIFGDAERTEQAVGAVLRVAAGFAVQGDVIELVASLPQGFVELTFRNSRNHGMRLNSSDRLSLSVAEANIRSQHGRYEFVVDPFRVSLALPVRDLGPMKCEFPLQGLNAQNVHRPDLLH